jgi:hypothetical protein
LANVLVIIAACYFAQGLAVIAFFHKNNDTALLARVTYVLIVFQQILRCW